MGRTAAGTAATTTTAEPRTPEIMESGHLANILTLQLVEMIDEATKRYEAAQLGRVMAPTLAALRGTVDDLRGYHRLAAIDWRTGQPYGETASGNGSAPAGPVPAAVIEAVES